MHKRPTSKARVPGNDKRIQSAVTPRGSQTCQRCGRALEQPTRGRPRTFCSDVCRLRAFRIREHEPQLTVPSALLEELAAVIGAGDSKLHLTLARALFRHDILRARKAAQAWARAHQKAQ